MRNELALVLISLLAVLAGCANPGQCASDQARARRIEQLLASRRPTPSPESEEKILALDPERVTEKDIREVLANAPAPRIINIQGGVLPFQFAMKSFSKFLIGMGYPEWDVRNPPDGDYSFSSYRSSAKFAGMIAWYYEKDGLRPMLVGHSLGGMQVIKTLHKLADQSSEPPAVWNPLTGKSEHRHEITDPLTGQSRSITGLQVSYASTLGAGGLARTIPNQWEIDFKLRKIPDTVEEFAGFYIGLDIFGGDYLGFGPANLFHPSGIAKVRNVRLPTGSSHATVPVTKRFSENPTIKDWINNYAPTDEPKPNEQSYQSNAHILWAADVWHSIKKHWVLELQRLIRARRATHHEP